MTGEGVSPKGRLFGKNVLEGEFRAAPDEDLFLGELLVGVDEATDLARRAAETVGAGFVETVHHAVGVNVDQPGSEEPSTALDGRNRLRVAAHRGGNLAERSVVASSRRISLAGVS
jgi:hypothetical protein